MPLGKNVKYRFKKGTGIRLAFKGGQVIESKNMKTGATHTPAEFAADRKKALIGMLWSRKKKVGKNKKLK